MIYAVFLCDKKWNIKRIRYSNGKLSLNEGDSFTELILKDTVLQNEDSSDESSYSQEVTFVKPELTVPAVIHCFKEGNLVVLAAIKTNKDFIEFNNAYTRYLEWARDCLLGLFRDEYYLIQQMNNQLIDAQRNLTFSNRKLEQALKENKKTNEKLEAARLSAEHAMKLAEQASRSKTEFLANMSHDIRTPMNAIVGITELMQHNLDKPKVLNNYIVKMRSSSQYLLELINDILDLSKIENGSMELKAEPMELENQIEQVLSIISPPIREKNLNLTVDTKEIRQACLMGDPVRLRQILMNILSNSVKYTPEGGSVNLFIRLLDDSELEQKYQFVIEDSGIGMTPEFLKRIFDPFARAEDSVGEIQGTGLGMAITKSIVDAMGGTISVNSVSGMGSRFTIELSFEKYYGEYKPVTEKTALSAEKEKVSFRLKGLRFLCAEDNELNAEILASMLELEGAECTVYGNGKLLSDAFETVRQGEYDAILMDVQMPVMNGYEAAREIRNSSNPLGKTIPIIAMTANAFAEDVEKAKASGMNDHLAKPLDIKRIRSILSKYIKN